jgi:hypothetical protein
MYVPGDQDGPVGFPDIHRFPVNHPGPYELSMGRRIAGLLRLFQGHVPDAESSARVLELASTPDRWSAAHAVFDEVRRRLLKINHSGRPDEWQYHFEESCCKALYNSSGPSDEFDPSSAFFVPVQALGLAPAVGVSVEAVVAVLVC